MEAIAIHGAALRVAPRDRHRQVIVHARLEFPLTLRTDVNKAAQPRDLPLLKMLHRHPDYTPVNLRVFDLEM
jgi:hypothetical protein